MNGVQAEDAEVHADAYLYTYMNICMDFAFKGKTLGEMPVLFF